MRQDREMETGADPFAGQRNIWMLWLQGADAAPEPVKACRRSWVERNPGWQLHFLSEETMGDHLTDEFRQRVLALNLPPQKTANLIRLHLLARHGGVWADADCYCPRPLDDWLPQLMGGGFFAFRFPAAEWFETNRRRPLARAFGRSSDRILSNWFLAGLAGNELGGMFLDRHLALLEAGEFGKRRRRRGIMRLATALWRRNAYLATKMSDLRLLRAAGTFPYFIFHYHFARLLLQEPEFDAAWKAVPSFIGKGTKYSQSLHLPVDAEFLDDFAGRGKSPVLKLHWHLDDGATIPGSRYRWLIDQGQI